MGISWRFKVNKPHAYCLVLYDGTGTLTVKVSTMTSKKVLALF